MNLPASVSFFVVLVVGASAHASEPNALTVAFESSGCTQSVTGLPLLEALRLELRSEGVVQITRVARSDRALMVIAQSCAGANDEVRVSVRRDENAEAIARSLVLADVPVELRARSVALASAELLRSARMVWGTQSGQPAAADDRAKTAGVEAVPGALPVSAPALASEHPQLVAADARAHPEPGSALVTAKPNQYSQRSDPERPPDVGLRVASAPLPQVTSSILWSIALGPTVRVFSAQSTVVYGAELSLHWDRWALAASGLWGGRSDALGSARFRLLDGSLAVTAWRAAWESWALRVGARGALGAVWGDAVANNLAFASDAVGLTWNITAQAAIARVLSRRWELQLVLHAGYAGGPDFSADARTLASLSGPLFGACLSAAMGLPF